METPSAARTRLFVVSMADAGERRAQFAAAAAGALVDWRFFDALTAPHPAMRYDEDGAIVAKGRALKPGELGCYASHFALWLQLRDDEQADQYIVLEDDVIADWTYLAALAEMDHGAMGHHYIRLYHKKPVRQRIIARDYGARATWLTEIFGHAFGTQGYLLTRQGARRFIAAGTLAIRPVDDMMDRSWDHGVRNLAVFPFPIIERRIASGIGLARFEAQPVPARLRRRRAWARLRERLAYHLAGRARFWLSGTGGRAHDRGA